MNIEELLDRLYTEPDIEKRRYIPDKLAKLGNWRSTEPLGRLIIDSSQPTAMRNEAIESLGKQGDPKAISYLIQVLSDSEDDIRRTAVWSLGQIGTAETLDPVFSMIDDPWVETRRWVAKSAGRIRSDKIIAQLLEYYNHLDPLKDQRVLADVIRALTNQSFRIYGSDQSTILDLSYRLLSLDLERYVKQAVMLLLMEFYKQGVDPNSELLIDLYHELPQNDPLVRPLIVLAMGYARNTGFLEKIDEDNVISAYGSAKLINKLNDYLNQENSDTRIIAALNGFLYTDYLPDLTRFYEHDNLTIRMLAYEIHARHGLEITPLLDLYNSGSSSYKLLEIMRYYGKQALSVLESSALGGDKVARQNSVYSLISDYMLEKDDLHDLIERILLEVAKTDPIWHIRRDARIGLEKMGRDFSQQ